MKTETVMAYVVFTVVFLSMAMVVEDQNSQLLEERAAHERTKAEARLAYDQLAHDMAINYALCHGIGVPGGE